MKDLFNQTLIKNGISDPWYFKEGMNFDDKNLWWGDYNKRLVPHEGVDFGYTINSDGKISNIQESFFVYNFLKGTVIKTIKDFIGESVFIKHDKSEKKRSLYSIYGHLQTDISKGPVSSFQRIGTISSRKDIPVHFHYSLVWIPENIDFKMLDWKSINTLKTVEFINPFKY